MPVRADRMRDLPVRMQPLKFTSHKPYPAHLWEIGIAGSPVKTIRKAIRDEKKSVRASFFD